MFVARQFKSDPALWEEFYQDQDTQRLDEFGFPALSSTKIVLRDKPEELQDLQGKIDAYWQSNLANNPKANNGHMYAMSGWSDIDYVDSTLIIHAYETDYASLLVKLNKEGATAEEAKFLDDNMMFLGASGFIRYNFLGYECYLAGQVAKKNIKQDMLESVPQGLVPYGFHEQEDPFRKTLEKECLEETSLIPANFSLIRPWGVNVSPRAGNFTLIYEMDLVDDNSKPSSEHHNLKFAGKIEITDQAGKYLWNPVTARLFEKVR